MKEGINLIPHLKNHLEVLKRQDEVKYSTLHSIEEGKVLSNQYWTVNGIHKIIYGATDKELENDEVLEKVKKEIIEEIENILKHYNK